MAADTAPAAVPDQPHQQATPGLLTSMLAPVEPARTAAFTIDPTTSPAAADGTLAGISSAAFHDDNTPENDPKNTNSGAQTRGRESVVRAWLLAGAERWKKGAGTGIKRLEVEKARAMAQQVRETRTVAVNRSAPAPQKPAASKAGGSGASGGGKGPAKTNSSAGAGPKNTAPKTSGTSGRGGAGHGAKAPAPKQPKQHAPAPAPKAPKQPTTPASSSRTSKPVPAEKTGGKTTGPSSPPKGSTGDKAPAKGKDGRNGSDAKAPTTKPSSGGTHPRTDKPTADTTKPGPRADKPTSTTQDRAQRRISLLKPRTATAPTAKPTDDTKRFAEPAATDAEKPTTPKTDQAKPQKTDAKTPAKPEKSVPANGQKASAPTPTGPLATREARETGYRDGARAGRTAAQVRAYRDGVKDGWADTTAAAAAERAVLDQAHAERQQQRDKEAAMPPAPPRPTRDPAVPIPVTGIDAASVHLGPGANRTALARGEVRTLKGFERRLDAKTADLQRVAETTKGLEDHADQQAQAATQLLEAAKTVEGGAKLVADLVRLQEAAQAQAAKAADIHTRAVRAADSCGAVLTNVATRYGGIYKAVVDSGEAAPAELDFYKEQ